MKSVFDLSELNERELKQLIREAKFQLSEDEELNERSVELVKGHVEFRLAKTMTDNLARQLERVNKLVKYLRPVGYQCFIKSGRFVLVIDTDSEDLESGLVKRIDFISDAFEGGSSAMSHTVKKKRNAFSHQFTWKLSDKESDAYIPQVFY